MAQLLADELTGAIRDRLSGADLDARAEQVILVATVDDRGWPHPAILSYFEVVARDSRNIRLATYKDSTTTANMRRDGKLTLSMFGHRFVCYVKGTVEELRREMRCAPYNSKLNMRVEQVLADHADPGREPGAYIASGVTCKNPNLAAERVKANEMLKELLE